jgi:hypothetical protein
MRIRSGFASLIAVAISSFVGGNTAMEGCSSMETASGLLTKLQERWHEWTLEKVLNEWPHPLTPVGWTLENGVATDYIYRGRVIDDECECCELFSFDGTSDGERLSGFRIYYSLSSRDDALDAARTLFSTLNFPNESQALEEEFWRTGNGILRWRWSGADKEQQEEAWLAEVSLLPRRGGAAWTVTLYFSRDYIG